MKNIVLFKTKNKNCYIYCLSKKQFYCIHEKVYYLLKEAEKGNDLKFRTFNEIRFKTTLIENETDFGFVKNKAIYYLNMFSNQNDPVGFIKKTSIDEIYYYLSGNPNICFEVTENCNLKCRYCTYNEYFGGFEKRTKTNLKFSDAKVIIDYVYKFCNSEENISHNKNINISFYGGEPLLRFNLIKKIIDYTKELSNQSLSFTYSMTTNGTLLDKFINEIVANKFDLLISLDGDKRHNAYRVYKDGIESHSKVHKNILQIKKLYPEYYAEHVGFNCVVHNLSNKNEITHFFKKNFGKLPDFSNLSYDNLKKEKNDDFFKVFKSKAINYITKENIENNHIEQSNLPKTGETVFIGTLTRYLTKDYTTLFQRQNALGRYTGTCIPFSRKFFVTAKGIILPCENIDHKFAFGSIQNGILKMDLVKLVDYYNQFTTEIAKKCNGCYRIFNCDECAFNLNNNGNKHFPCFTNKKKFENYLSENISNLENNPTNFHKILKDGIIL